MRDFTDDLRELRRRLDEARGVPEDRRGRDRLVELEAEIGRPDLWDDAERGQAAQHRVRQRPRRRRRRSTRWPASSTTPRCSTSWPARRTTSRRSPRSRPRSPTIAHGLDQLELRSLFTGEHDEADCIVQINAKDGGVDAQDWSEMLLRMYERWAERAGFGVRAQRRVRGHRGGHHVGRVHAHRPLRLRADDERARHAPAGADQPVRQPGPAPDELRRRAGVAGDGRPRRRAQRRRHPHGGVPGVGCRRPARQQDVVGGAPDPRADRPRGQLAGGAQPAAEPGEGDEPAEGDGRGQDRGGARRPSSTRSPASRPRSAGAARSAATCCSPTRW